MSSYVVICSNLYVAAHSFYAPKTPRIILDTDLDACLASSASILSLGTELRTEPNEKDIRGCHDNLDKRDQRHVGQLLLPEAVACVNGYVLLLTGLKHINLYR